MHLHAVAPTVNSMQVYSKETSCYRECCFSNDEKFAATCETWKLHNVQKETNENIVIDNETNDIDFQFWKILPREDEISVTVNEYVCAVYSVDNRPCIGKVLSVDGDSVHVDFMELYVKDEPTTQHFHWPKRKDKIWVGGSNIFCGCCRTRRIQERVQTTIGNEKVCFRIVFFLVE